MTRSTRRVLVYGCLALLGLVLPSFRFVSWLREHGLDPRAMMRELFSTRVGAFFGMDLLITAVVVVLFILFENRRSRVRYAWTAVLGTLCVGVSFGLPLYLLLRELEGRSGVVVTRFVSAINAHDLDRLATLMTDEHVLIDSSGARVEGREAVKEAWARFLTTFPDYSVEVRRSVEEGGFVGMCGLARGTSASDDMVEASARWEIPAAWEAKVTGGKVAVWRVFADLEPVRKIVGSKNQ